jgi:hypothetical protein
MDPFLSFAIWNLLLQTAVNLVERERRKRILRKWVKGELSMEQLLWLKKQKWFLAVFKVQNMSPEKKNL